MKITKSLLLYITYWFSIGAITFLCATGKLDDDIYMLMIGIMLGHTISNYIRSEKENEKKKSN